MTITDAEIELVARRYCEALGLDPDAKELMRFGAEVSVLTNAEGMRRQAHEAIAMHRALAALDPPPGVTVEAHPASPGGPNLVEGIGDIGHGAALNDLTLEQFRNRVRWFEWMAAEAPHSGVLAAQARHARNRLADVEAGIPSDRIDWNAP